MSTSHLLPWPKMIPAQVRAANKLNEKMAMVLGALEQAGDKGATSRDISDTCDLSIYSARNWLIKLEEADFIYHRRIDARKTLWFIK